MGEEALGVLLEKRKQKGHLLDGTGGRQTGLPSALSVGKKETSKAAASALK